MPLRRSWPLAFAAVLLVRVASAPADPAPADDAPFLRFRGQEIDKTLKIGYSVIVADVNGDGKKDVVVADKARVVWFENAGPAGAWKMRLITEGKTELDNVCVEALDVDGDGQLDVVLGGGWKPPDTTAPAPLYWLGRGKTLDEPWSVHLISREPSVHRVHLADLDGDGKPRIILAPLQGRGSTGKGNWSEAPARLLAFKVPADPSQENWTPEVLAEQFHAMHNVTPVRWGENKGVKAGAAQSLLVASYEGVHHLVRNPAGGWQAVKLCDGDQSRPQGSRGSSEVKLGRLKNGQRFIATIEPWHGNTVVVYTPPADPEGLWVRHVVDTQLKSGHGLWCADFDGDGEDEIVVGFRDPLNDNVHFGLNAYKASAEDGSAWRKQVLDNGGVAVEDLFAADLDGDGTTDLVAVGRATGNVKIYWNEGKK